MDNVIQHIKIEDIVPSNHNYNQVDIKALEDLAISIKNNGIKEPLRLRKMNNKYKIISGNKRYRAAILAGLSELPAIIEDYNALLKYLKPNDTNYSNSINNNSDIVNLSELNKEYERDDFKMNNELINNNNIPEQPQAPQNVAPTFGGRFFPSLEDEPTNMAFNNVIEPTPEVVPGPQPANNLIDLTDTGVNMQNPVMSEPIQNMPSMEQPIGPTMAPQPEINNNVMPQNNGSIIDIASLTQNNSMVSPTPEPVMPTNVDNNFQEAINDFQATPSPEMMTTPLQPTMEQPLAMNPVELNQNPVMPEQPALNIQPEPILNPMDTSTVSPMPSLEPMMNEPINMPQDIMATPAVDLNMVTPMADNIGNSAPEMMTTPINPMPSFDNSMVQPTSEPVLVSQPVENPIAGPEMATPAPQKDILPVINTLKAVGVNLENFGYTIRITDEDLPTSYKITIEVDK